MTSECTADEFL